MYLQNIEWEGVSPNPNYWCDTYISYAEHENGDPLTNEELENLDEGVIYEYLVDSMPWI